MKQILTLLLCATLVLSLVVPSFAAAGQTEQETAAAWLKENGILTGDQNGNLHLDSGLTRAELAVILTRLSDETGDMDRNAAYYRTICPFTDVPEWAMPFAGYCAQKQLMAGYGNKQFGPNDPVTPAAACTVMLRYLDCPASQWTYATACDKAAELGLLPDGAADGASITRGNIAVLIYRALNAGKPGDGQAALQGVGDGYLTNGKPITEENVLELLREIEQDWPTGTVWGTHNTPGTHKNEVPSTKSGKIMRGYHVSNTYGCGAYASMVSSMIFGDVVNPGRKLEHLDELRPGDIVFLVKPDGEVSHVAIALESPNAEGRFHRTDGNSGEMVVWPNEDNPDIRSYSLSGFTGYSPRHLEAWTRYPKSISYTGNSVEIWPMK